MWPFKKKKIYTTYGYSKDHVLSEEEQKLADRNIYTALQLGYEVFEVTEEKTNFGGKLTPGWYWLTWNTPRKGMWFAGPFSSQSEADEDARNKVLPCDDHRRENESFDGVLPGADVRYAWGERGTADTPLRDFDQEKKECDEYNNAVKEGRVEYKEYK